MGIEGIGARVARKEDKRFITGKGRYTDDMAVPGMKHAHFLRSPHAHARIVSIDTGGAEALVGREGVITCDDVPGQDGFGVFVSDQPVMARGKVRYVGEAIAAVAAEDVTSAPPEAARMAVAACSLSVLVSAASVSGASRTR